MTITTQSHLAMQQRLGSLPGLWPSGSFDMFTTSDPARVVQAQIELVRGGYTLVQSDVHEEAFYQMQFMHLEDDDASMLILRYMPNYAQTDPYIPRLALVYHDGGALKHFTTAGRTVPEMSGPIARRLLSLFCEFHPGIEPLWLPAFDGSPLLAS